MATLTIELDDEVLRKVERAAERDHLTVERWVCESLAEVLAEEPESKSSFSETLARCAGTAPDIVLPSDEDLPPLDSIELDEA